MVATPSALAVEARYLAGRTEARSRPLAVVGASLGVPPVVAWAAKDTLPKAVALLYGGGKLRLLLEAELKDEIGWAWLRGLSARTLAWLLSPIEPTRSVAAIAPRPLLLVAAANDERVPRESALSLFAAAKEPKRLVWFGGGHMQPTDAEVTAALTDTCVAFFAAVLPARR